MLELGKSSQVSELGGVNTALCAEDIQTGAENDGPEIWNPQIYSPSSSPHEIVCKKDFVRSQMDGIIMIIYDNNNANPGEIYTLWLRFISLFQSL